MNKIGEIVNLSQELNTLMWDMLNCGASFDDVKEIYYDSSKLCIMSGVEIDAAKKEFNISNTAELKKLKEKYDRRDKDGRMVKPGFFGFVAKTKGYYNPKKKQYKSHHTTMDYLQQVIRRGYKNGRGKAAIPFYEILDNEKFDIERVRYEQVNLVIDAVRTMRQQSKHVWLMYQKDKESACGGAGTSDNSLYNMTAQIAFDLYQDCIDYIDSMRFSYSTMYWLLKSIESDQCADIRSVLFNMLFGAPNRNFYKAIRASVKPIQIIVPDERGDINVYGMKYKHTYAESAAVA